MESRIGNTYGFKLHHIPWNKGKHLSQKHKRNVSKSMKGKKQTKEHIKKRISFLLGNKNRLGMKNSDFWRQQIKLKNSGINNGRWIYDRTKLKTDRQKMYDTQYKFWMLEVKKRDNWKCKINNKDCKGRLEAHHILNWVDYPELRYEVNNGITLCHAHHPHKRVEEAELSPYFQNLVAEMK